ncbi:general odorant-binding protein 57c [Anastrepha obliqua]|uniref:general odorant-binding protein 57c n=1 Tax=Anastrepha obliqua TaxID=95512 RepID=UPI002409C1F9|nr:general odorant-binding protein 57c [Anastrepha obliqua]
MYQFGVDRANATERGEMYSGGKGMALPRLTWLVIFAAAILFLMPLGRVTATPTGAPSSFVQACQEQHKITEEELDELPDDPNPEDIDMKYKCYANCLLNGLGFMDENGKLNAEMMHDAGILNDDSYEDMIECKAANDMEDDPCEYSFGVMLCARMIHANDENDEYAEAVPMAREVIM